MCLICILWDKEKLTRKEADRALAELVIEDDLDEEHVWEVLEKIEGEEDGRNT